MRFLLLAFLWILLLNGATLQKEIKIEGKYYFTPALANDRVALFGYISKFKPTKMEIEKQRQLFKRLIDEGIKREYGGWEGYEKALKRSAKKVTKNAPDWLTYIFPPKIVEEAAPLLMKGALLYAMKNPHLSKEPIGNLGMCGVVIVHEDGRYKKIALGINQPVVWIDFSKDKKYVAVLSDASFEKDRYYTFGKIDIISLKEERVIKSYLLANVVSQIGFTPDSRYLAFIVQNPKKWEKKALRFIDMKNFNITSNIIPFEAVDIGSSVIVGKNYKNPLFLFNYDGSIVCMRDQKYGVTCTNMKTKRVIYKNSGGGRSFDLSPRYSLLFDAKGNMVDLSKNRVVYHYIQPSAFRNWSLEQVKFKNNGESVIIRNIWGKLLLFDKGLVLAQTERFDSISKRFFYVPNRVFSFERDKNGFVTYHGYLKREKRMLRIYDANSLRLLKDIRFLKGSVIDAAATKNRLFVSGFDSIKIYDLN